MPQLVDFWKKHFQDPQPTTVQGWANYSTRQRALADALSNQAMTGVPRETGGRIVPKYGIGEGLSRLGTALLARRQGKRATEAESTALSERNKAMAAALGGTPYAGAQSAINAGVDPNIAMRAATPETLVAVIGEDGQPQYVRESDAVGQQPYSMAPQGLGAADLQLYNRYLEQARAAGQQPMDLMQWKQAYSKASVGAQYGQPSDVAGLGVVQPSRTEGPAGNVVLSPETTVSSAEAQRAGAREAATTAAGQGGVNVTPGQRAVDEKFAATYAEWQAGGGYADVQKNLDQLRSVRQRLGQGENLTGGTIGYQPRALLAKTNPNALNALEQVEEVVQRNLRLILGAQFTEKEGERLIARAYNPNLDEALNADRLDRLITALDRAAQAKQEASDYFSQHGTLAGWDGSVPSIADVEKSISNETEAPTGEPTRISGDDEYDQLQSGAQFIGPDGKLRVKP